MTIDTRVIRSEPHVDIGALLENDAETLVELWCQRAAEEQPSAQRVHNHVLRDHFPKLLRAIGKALKQAGNPEAMLQARAALQHGEQRWENGWSLTEVVRDYEIMRLVILEYLDDTLSRPLNAREIMAICVFIDDAIAASVASYTGSRDEEVLHEQRERAASLEAINRRKDEFMAMLGHELRNPLAPIQTAVKIIQSLPAATHPAILTAVDVIQRQSKHMVRLVDDILDLARIGQGRFELRKSRFDIATAVHQAVEATDSLFKSRNQSLTVSLPSSAIYVDADLSRLVQVIGNLLNNASKYTEVAGHISISAEREEGHLTVRVLDSGMGIPPEMVSRVFDLFTQVEGTEQFAEGGMGIGLALVRRLVEQHGGAVSCHSAGLGRGSEFIVRLPVSAQESRAESQIQVGPLVVAPLGKNKSDV